MILNKNLRIAIQAALEAGVEIMKVYESNDFNIEIKGDNSPLTQADKMANDVINTYLLPTKIPIISEENKQIDFNIRKNWDTCWIVDPVDGTKEFIKRNGEFTVNIALTEKGKTILGVVLVPASAEIYFSDVIQKKAFKSKLDTLNVSIEKVLKLRKEVKPESGGENGNTVRVVGSRSHMSQETIDFINKLKSEGKEVKVVSKGSSLKLCLVAEGKADVYPRFAPTMEWDTAAGQAICNAVAVEVIDVDTQEGLLYNKENLLNPWFVCK